jgi:hypothetical protein
MYNAHKHYTLKHLLLESGINTPPSNSRAKHAVDQRMSWMDACVFTAIERGDSDRVAALIADKPDKINSQAKLMNMHRYEIFTPLRLAARNGCTAIAEMLLNAGGRD